MELLQNFTYHHSQLLQFVVILGVSLTSFDLINSSDFKNCISRKMVNR